jgi:hypothetical protein
VQPHLLRGEKMEKFCELCGTSRNLEEHHVFHGTANRKLSEKYGLKMWLCQKHHTGDETGNKEAIHFNKGMDLFYKKKYQQKFEREHGTREDFIKIFGRNYLEV